MKNIFILMLLLMLLQSCVSDEPEALNIYPQSAVNLQLELINNDVQADNYSFATITATTGLQNNESIVFTTDKGSFSNGEKTYTATSNSGEPVNAYLKNNKNETARVSANVSNRSTKEITVNFVRAYPTSIIVNPAVSTLPSAITSTTIINSKLLRLNGSVSDGMVVTYKDSTGVPNGISIGTFLNNTPADAQGNAAVQYWIQDESFQNAFLYIITQVKNDEGLEIARGMNRIYIE